MDSARSKAVYEKYMKGSHWEKHPTIYAGRFAGFLGENNFGGFMVDIGCGNGRDLNIFDMHGLNAIGIDNSQKQIIASTRKFPHLRFEIQDAEHLNFKDEIVGAVYMINIIQFVDKKKAISEVHRVLKPRGYFLLHIDLKLINKNGRVDYEYTEEEVMELVSKFKILEKKKFIRVDMKPVKHTHLILELLMQKK